MEEGVPPVGDPPPRSLTTTTTTSSNPPGTYVVQVPRDQVYRIPPPEHAKIIEYHIRNAPQQQKKNCAGCWPLCWMIVAIVLLAVIAVVSIFIVRATLYNFHSPQFTITRLQTKHLDKISHYQDNPPEYDIMLQAMNHNHGLYVAYHGAGKATLDFKNQKIGQGGIPSMVKTEPDSNVDIPVTLFGKGLPLSPAIKKSLNDTNEKAMNLKIEVPIEVNSWVRNQKMDLNINCDFRVQNLLKKNVKILFQDCQAKI